MKIVKFFSLVKSSCVSEDIEELMTQPDFTSVIPQELTG